MLAGADDHLEPGLPLLRETHLAVAHDSLRRETPARTARALRSHRLLALAPSRRPRTLRQTRWTNTLLKTLSPHWPTSP
ncbi:hypothetical protein ACFQ9J_27290 [Streptomyces sp. NPDC056529]|uniref:hypothetical protein n=1 Tax=Streptomyces sp. NPDC056529 TaxID=3345855 RepID=UPI00367C64E1